MGLCLRPCPQTLSSALAFACRGGCARTPIRLRLIQPIKHLRRGSREHHVIAARVHQRSIGNRRPILRINQIRARLHAVATRPQGHSLTHRSVRAGARKAISYQLRSARARTISAINVFSLSTKVESASRNTRSAKIGCRSSNTLKASALH